MASLARSRPSIPPSNKKSMPLGQCAYNSRDFQTAHSTPSTFFKLLHRSLSTSFSMKAFVFSITAVSKMPHYKSHWLEFIAKEGGFKLIERIIVTGVDQNLASVLGVRAPWISTKTCTMRRLALSTTDKFSA